MPMTVVNDNLNRINFAIKNFWLKVNSVNLGFDCTIKPVSNFWAIQKKTMSNSFFLWVNVGANKSLKLKQTTIIQIRSFWSTKFFVFK